MRRTNRSGVDLSAMKTGERFNPFNLFHCVMVPLAFLKAKISVAGKLTTAKNTGAGGKLSIGAKVCWGVLAYYAGDGKQCYPLQQTIADDMGVSVDRVKDYIAELEAAGLIEIEYRSSGRIRQSYYFFLWHPCFLERSDEVVKTPPRKQHDEVVKLPSRGPAEEVAELPPREARRSGEIARDEVVKTPLALKEEENVLRELTANCSQPAVSSYPKTAAEIRKLYATADADFVQTVITLSLQSYASVAHPKIPHPDDAILAKAVKQARAESPGQQKAGLFKSTVPAVVHTWAEYGIPENGIPAGPLAIPTKKSTAIFDPTVSMNLPEKGVKYQ